MSEIKEDLQKQSDYMTYFGITDILACLKWPFKNERTLFEREFARYLGARFAIGTSYGRTALYLGLKALDVKHKEVIRIFLASS